MWEATRIYLKARTNHLILTRIRAPQILDSEEEQIVAMQEDQTVVLGGKHKTEAQIGTDDDDELAI